MSPRAPDGHNPDQHHPDQRVSEERALEGRDVRMRGFARRTTVRDTLAWVEAAVLPLDAELVPLDDAGGRVLAQPLVAEVDVPAFDRAMMDGYALRAEETWGAGPYNPLTLRLVGQSLPGRPCDRDLAPGEAARIMTGAPLPTGADAVLPAEQARTVADAVEALGEVSPGKHVGRRGEDIRAGATALPAGRLLRPQDVGVLASLGCSRVEVVRRPVVRIVVTGDELAPAGAPRGEHQIGDANGPMLESLVRRDGGLPVRPGIVRDVPAEILAALREPADLLLVSGGSSVGVEDHAPRLLAEHGELSIHGVAVRPSSPVGMGRLAGRPVFLLPGNPVSCLCAYDLFAGRAVRRLAGRSPAWPYPRVRLPLDRKLVSQIGRVDYARVRLIEDAAGTRVEPLAVGGASILSGACRADGFVLVAADSEGYPEGALVEVHLYDSLGAEPAL